MIFYQEESFEVKVSTLGAIILTLVVMMIYEGILQESCVP